MKLKFANALSLALIMAMLFTSIGMAQGTPSITSDLPDYAPGATVNLFGADWGAGASVHIVAGDDGAFTDTFQLPDWFVATYSVTATGTTSGTATTGFTDGTSNISFGIGPSSVVQGAPLTWNASATCAGPASGSSSCIASGTSVNGPVPNGYTVNVVYKLQASAITNPGSCQFNSGTVQADSQTTTGGSASGSFSAPATIGTYCYKAEHPNQNIGSFSWAAQNNSTNVIITVVAAPSDTTPPVISYTLNPASPDGNNGWYKSNVQLTWSVTDPESAVTKTGCVNQNITADQVATTYSCSASSTGGSAAQVDVTIKRDATQPGVSWSGGITNGANFVYGSVPAAPTCSATDVLSGPDTCAVIGYGTAVGSYILTATAYDKAGNSKSETRSYTVGKANAIITVTPYNVTYNGAAHTAGGSATGVNGENLNGLLDLSGTTHTDAGTYNGDAWSFAGDGNYNSANGTVNDSIGQASSTVTVTCPSSVVFNGAAQTPCTAKATGVGMSDVASTVSYGANTNAGTATADASWAGDANHTGNA